MKPINIYFIILLVLIVTSCKKDDAQITVGFTSDNPSYANQGSTETFNIKVGLNAVADRDIYIKYSVDEYFNSVQILDTSYFIIRKGEQYRTVPFKVTDKKQKEDYNIIFHIYQVYNAIKDENSCTHNFKIKTTYLPTQATGLLTINGVAQNILDFNTFYIYENSINPIGDRYGFNILLTDFSSVHFHFYKFPEEGKQYAISTAGSTSGYIVSSYFYDQSYSSSFKHNAVSGDLTVSKLDTLNKKMDVSFDGFYNQYGHQYSIKGNANFSRYNFD